MNNLEQLKIPQPKLCHKALIIKTQGNSFEFWINLSSGSVGWCKAGRDDPMLFLDQFQLPQEVLGSVEERLNTNQVPNTEVATSCNILLSHMGHCPHIKIVFTTLNRALLKRNIQRMRHFSFLHLDPASLTT